MESFVSGLKEVFNAEGIKLGIIQSKAMTQRQINKAVVIFEYTWKAVYDIFDSILKVSEDEVQIQQCIYAIRCLVSLSGSIDLKPSMEEIVRRLCDWEFPQTLEDKSWNEGYKHIYISKAILSIAHLLNKLLTNKTWSFIFCALQKINSCVNKLEGDPSEAELLHFNALSKKIAENIARYLPKSKPEIKLPLHYYAPSAGTGESGGLPFEEVKNPLSPDRLSCLSDDDKDVHIQQVNRSGINTAILLKQRTKKYMSEIEQHDLDVNIRKSNTLLSERESYSFKSDRLFADKNILKGDVKEAVVNIRSLLESLFVCASSFNVRVNMIE